MKNLVNDIMQQMDEGKIDTHSIPPKGTKKPPAGKPLVNDPKDPLVLVRGFGTMREKQAQSLKMDYEPYKSMTEAVETKIQMTMPLFIRIMEWAKEEAKDDVALHQLAEKLAAVNGVADMDNYESLLESAKSWVRTAEYALKNVPEGAASAALNAFGTGNHEEVKQDINAVKRLSHAGQKAHDLIARKLLGTKVPKRPVVPKLKVKTT